MTKKKKNRPVFIRFKADQEQGNIIGVYLKVQDQYKNLTLGQFNQLPENANTPQYKESVERINIIGVSSLFPEPIVLDNASAEFVEINGISRQTGFKFVKTIYCRYDWPINGLTSNYEIFYSNKDKDFIYRFLDINSTGSEQTEVTLSETDIAFFFKTEGTLRWRHPAGPINNPWWPPFSLGVDSSIEYNQGFATLDLNNMPVINWSLSYCYFHAGNWWIIAQDWNTPPEGEIAQVIITGKYVIDQNQYTPPISPTPVHPLRRERIKTTKDINLEIKVKENKYKTDINPVTTEVWTDTFNKPPSFFYDLYFKWDAVLGEPAGELIVFDEQPPEEQRFGYYIHLAEHKAIFKIKEDITQPANSYIKMIDEKGEDQLPLSNEGTDYIKIISQLGGYEWPIKQSSFFNDTMGRQLYFSLRQVETGGYTTSEMKPMIMKKNDDYMFLVSEWDKCLVWKDGIEYVLPTESSFNINGLTVPVEDKWRWNISGNIEGGIDAPQFADYCAYFQDFGMCCKYLVPDDGNYKWVNYTYEEWNSFVYYFNTSTWYGDYLYKVRVDEFYDGTFFRDELIKHNYPTNILEVIQKEIKKDLKIYRPETTSLWVEKYKLTLDTNNLTAKIEYIRRFKVPFTPPVTEEIALLQPTTQKTSNNDSVSHITQLRDIFYIP